MRPATVAIHGGTDGAGGAGPAAVPVVQTAAFGFASARQLADVFRGRAPGHVYTRISNPTTAALEQRLARMEGGVGAIATASGMGAISAVLLGLLRAGDEVLSVRGIFGGTISLMANVLTRFGIRTTFLPADDPGAFARAVTAATRVIFVETITNPTMEVPDLPALAAIAREHNIPLVVDATVTTPAVAQVGGLGADIVVHSTTKFINGHGTAIGGAIVDTGSYRWREGRFEDIATLARRAGQFAFLAHLRNVIYRDLGACPSPGNSSLMLQGLETLAPRMRVHLDNARRLAEFLRGCEEVAWVNYPGLDDSRYRPTVDALYGGQGGSLLSMGLRPGLEPFAFMDALELALRMTNLGDARTLVLHPASTIFAEFDPAHREQMGISDDMIRVSVGIEAFEDIREDFRQAMQAAATGAAEPVAPGQKE